MKDKCIKEVSDIAGRSITNAEAKTIEGRIIDAKRQLASKDQAKYLAMSDDQRLKAAAKLVAENLTAEAAKEKQRIALRIQKHDAIGNYMKDSQDRGINGIEALDRFLDDKPGNDSNVQTVASRITAVTEDYTRRLLTLLETASPKALGMYANKTATKAILYELFGEDSSSFTTPEMSRLAKKSVEEWKNITEIMRQHFNNAGGVIGKLEDWRMPQTWHQDKILAAGMDSWIKDIQSFGLNRKRYINEDGSMMTDEEFQKLLEGVWLTIATGGSNKIEAGSYSGNASLAGRHSENRVLHFLGADGYIKAQEKYGSTDFYSVMMQHIKSLSRDIAIVEKFGPNADNSFNYWLQESLKTESERLAKSGDPKERKKVADLKSHYNDVENLYNQISGRTYPVASKWLAQSFDTLKNLIMAASLGSSVIPSIGDNASMRLGVAINGMSHLQLFRNQLATLDITNRKELKMAQGAGLALDTYMGEINKWAHDTFATRWSRNLASLTVRISGLNAADQAKRRAFGASLYNALGEKVGTFRSLGDIKEEDRRILDSNGVTEKDWSVWRKAELEDWGNGSNSMLTPESIYRIQDVSETDKREAALALLGMVSSEIKYAIPTPSQRQRAWVSGGLTRGTWKGELASSFALMKGFPFASVNRHIGRGMGLKTASGKVAYIASYVAMSTILGAIALQISEVVSGRDPLNMIKKPMNFMMQSILKGGGLGIYGDFLFNLNTQYGSSPLAVFSGPVVSFAEKFINLTQGNLMALAKGKKTNFMSDSINTFKSITPLQNLWYTKAVTDRLIFQKIQEWISPGYNAKAQARAEKLYDKKFFWNLGKTSPKRAPDLERAIGKE